MINISEIKQMSKQEKLHLMETIWQQLSVDEEQIDVPQSHIEMLEKREAMVKRGESEFIDWQEAKEQITKATQ